MFLIGFIEDLNNNFRIIIKCKRGVSEANTEVGVKCQGFVLNEFEMSCFLI